MPPSTALHRTKWTRPASENVVLACLCISFTWWQPRPKGSDFRSRGGAATDVQYTTKKKGSQNLQNAGLLRKGRLLELITRPEYIVEWEKLYDLNQGPVEAPQCPSENKNQFENQGTDAKNQAVVGD